MVEAVDWAAYFDSIRSQCPWSAPAWAQGRILVCSWDPAVIHNELGQYQAILYVCDSLTPEQVESWAESLDQSDPDHEWFFSYPGYGDWATPVTVLIQQDRAALNLIRQRLGDSTA